MDVPKILQKQLKEYARLEGMRKGQKLVEDAAAAYLRVLQKAVEGDPSISKEAVELLKENGPRQAGEVNGSGEPRKAKTKGAEKAEGAVA